MQLTLFSTLGSNPSIKEEEASDWVKLLAVLKKDLSLGLESRKEWPLLCYLAMAMELNGKFSEVHFI